MSPRDGPSPEAGCNCDHLAPSATCYACTLANQNRGGILREPDDDQDDDDPVLLTDGGTRAPSPRPESNDDPASAVVVDALETRVDRLEEELADSRQTNKDLVAMIHQLRERVDDLEGER